MLIAFGNSSKKLSISKTWWFVLNFSDIFLADLVSSVLSMNFTETDSISWEGYSFRNNARTSVESIPELRDIPIFLWVEPILADMFFLIEFSTKISGFSTCLISKSCGKNFLSVVSRFVE